MSFELSQRKHIEDEVRQIARRELRDAIRSLRTNDGENLPSAVHEARKTVKKVRAIVTFLRQAGVTVSRKDRKRLKSAARALSRLRDSTAIIDTFDRVRRRYPRQLPEHTYGILRRGLVGARDRQERQARRDGVVEDAADRLRNARASTKKWKLAPITLPEMITVISSTYRQSRKAMRRASATQRSATVHEWRKDVKALWYLLRLAKALIVPVAPMIRDLKRLETALGDDHNLVILAATLRSCRDLRSMYPEIRKIDRLAARMRLARRRQAFVLGRRVHVRTPQAFARWLRTSSRPTRPSHRAAA